MSYSLDKKTGDIIFAGHEHGIADDPYSGISDMRNMNIISVPKEASVNFSTSKISYPTVTALSVVSSDATGDTITVSSAGGFNLLLETRMAITFSATTIGGTSTGTVYWLGPPSSGVTFQLFTDQSLSSLVNITSNSTATLSTLNPTKLLNWAYDPVHTYYYAVDSTGYVWGTNYTTTSLYWTFTGNTTVANANGRGLVCYQTSNNTVYLLVFRNKRIDYALSSTPMTWTYGWIPTSGSSGGDSMITGASTNNSHQALVGQDNTVYYCDANYIGSFFEITGKVFNPTDTTTYTYAQKALTLPFIDTAQCLAELGINLLVGGLRNQIYPWDRKSTSFSYPILLAEYNIQQMITVNTNTFIFVGNRGRIWITNGTQAQMYKKIPDHISGTVEPYFTWGGVTSIKNQLYFGVSATTNAGVAITQYGGVWAIDLDSKAIRLTSQLSYATYAGIASLIFPILSSAPAGTGLYIGWYDGVSVYGIDQTSSTPYTDYQSYVDYDNVPIGTFLTPRTFINIQWKLAKPLVSGEGVKVSARLDFSQSFTLVWENNTAGSFSDVSPNLNFEKCQWIQLRVETKSTGSSPSYTRLTELRII